MPRGGFRPGSGRKKGRKDDKTIAKERAIQTAREELIRGLTQEEIDNLSPREIIMRAARAEIAAGDFRTAAGLVKDLLPYTERKLAPETPATPGLPPELMPDGPDYDAAAPAYPGEPGPVGHHHRQGQGDPQPVPDEPGPSGGVIG
jgi:hypothetical protein